MKPQAARLRPELATAGVVWQAVPIFEISQLESYESAPVICARKAVGGRRVREVYIKRVYYARYGPVTKSQLPKVKPKATLS